MQPDENPQQDGWSFRVEGSDDTAPLTDEPYSNAAQEPISWTGSEFLHQQKNAGWYTVLFIVITAVAVGVYFISKDILSSAFIIIMGILFAIIAGRKPRELSYIIDEKGLSVGSRLYRFSDFKSFSLQRDGAIGYIKLMPLKRFQPELSIYYAPEDEQRIFDSLARNIPHDQRKESFIDQFTKKIRF